MKVVHVRVPLFFYFASVTATLPCVYGMCPGHFCCMIDSEHIDIVMSSKHLIFATFICQWSETAVNNASALCSACLQEDARRYTFSGESVSQRWSMGISFF